MKGGNNGSTWVELCSLSKLGNEVIVVLDRMGPVSWPSETVLFEEVMIKRKSNPLYSVLLMMEVVKLFDTEHPSSAIRFKSTVSYSSSAREFIGRRILKQLRRTMNIVNFVDLNLSLTFSLLCWT